MRAIGWGSKCVSLCAAAILIVTLASSRQAFAQAVAGSVTTVSGTVTLQRGTARTPVTTGVPVDVGDTLITGADGHVVVTLTDSSTLELGDSSTFTLDSHGPPTTRIHLLTGVLRSFVNRTAGAASPNFQVQTPNAVAAVRGTKFDTAYVGGTARPSYGDCRAFTDISVYDGVVFLGNVSNPTVGVDVPAGYEATVPCSASATSPGPLGMTGASSLSSGLHGNTEGTATAGSAGISPIAPVPPPVCSCPMGEMESPPPSPPPPPRGD